MSKAASAGEALIPFVDLAAQHKALGPALEEAMRGVLYAGDFILGKGVDALEAEFAAFTGARHGVGVSSGLDALRLALAALNAGPGDQIILPANTYIATALAVSAVGARPVLVDIDPETYNIDPALVEDAVTSRTRAILPVHLGGRPAEMDPILAVARERGLHVIEDAAQAHGALYKGKPCGSLGAMGCFSFYPSKNLGACGDGGMIVTNDDNLARRLKSLRNYGQEKKHVHLEKGLNARLDTMQAAILRVKLPHLKRWNALRAAHAKAFIDLLTGVGDLAFQKPDPASVYHLFLVETDQRDALAKHLHEANIQTAIHYPTPIHLQPAYRDLGLPAGSFPKAERFAKRTLSLPMFPELTQEQIERTADAVKGFFGSAKKSSKKAGR
jgi:dTDP-4-amino-4,6-dideoxygalactose transaminase